MTLRFVKPLFSGLPCISRTCGTRAARCNLEYAIYKADTYHLPSSVASSGGVGGVWGVSCGERAKRASAAVRPVVTHPAKRVVEGCIGG